MYICFAEYRIIPEHREAYLIAARRLEREESGTMRLYEGTDQPGLFVEVWQEATQEAAEHRKKERQEGRSSWCELTSWIAGGEAKLHMWTFRTVNG